MWVMGRFAVTHRLQDWHHCKDHSPWHPSSGWWHLRILVTKRGWFWFSAAKTGTCRCNLFLTPHTANPCLAEPTKRLGVHGPGSGASKPTEKIGAQEKAKGISDFPWTQESQPKLIPKYTEQIYICSVSCFHLFPGGEIEEFAMMSLVPLYSNPQNLHSTFHFTLPDVPPQPKPSTAWFWNDKYLHRLEWLQ